MQTFPDRVAAGRALGKTLTHLAAERPVVLGLPRGGVPVAAQVAAALDAPLDLVVVRKLGVPGRPELGMGAIGEEGVLVVNRDLVDTIGVTDDQIRAVRERETDELRRRVDNYRSGRPPLELTGRTAVVVDDGLATGFTARAAIEVVRRRGARRVVLAVPVSAPSTAAALREIADEVVCVITPRHMWAVGEWYDDFTQTSDEEVLALLAAGRARPDPPEGTASAGTGRPEETLTIELGDVVLVGDLAVPAGAAGLVVFAHGSGSSRKSPRNRRVAGVLRRRGLGTLLFDLLTDGEATDRRNVFDIPFLAGRLVETTRWLDGRPDLRELPLGYFGASTGAGAALWAAADLPERVRAVVSRGGRPDLAAPRLAEVRAATLLIVGGDDTIVVDLNRRAAAAMTAEPDLVIVPGATHLFEEPGALDEVAELAAEWFGRHLALSDGP